MNILICFTGEFGGTDLLLKRYSKWLQQNNDIVTEIFPDKLKNNMKLVKYDLVVLPTSQIKNLIKLKFHGVNFDRILIWCMGHGSFRAAYYNASKAKNKLYIEISKYVSKITLNHFFDLGSCIFTDEVSMNFELKNKIILSENNFIFPVAVETTNKYINSFNNFKKNNLLNLCWLGRVSKDFKVKSIISIIDDIEKYVENGNIKEKIIFNIIGDGDGKELLIERLRKIKSSQIEFKIFKDIEYEDIGTYLSNNIDCLFAMGTAALDGAKIGCPTVVVDPMTMQEDYKPCKYRWIFESKGYSTGEFDNMNIKPLQIKKNFLRIYEELENDILLNKKSYEYAKNFEEHFVFTNLRARTLPSKLKIKSYLFIGYLCVINKIKVLFKRLKK